MPTPEPLPTATAPEAPPLLTLASRLAPAARNRLIMLLGRAALRRARALSAAGTAEATAAHHKEEGATHG